jgi:hypothetical protein
MAADPQGATVNDYQADDEFSTGDADVDAALDRLDGLDSQPVDEHAAVYDDVHRRLGAVLDGSADGTPPAE